jgi:hypothetical protein
MLSGFRRHAKHTVVVHLLDGTSLRGVLLATYRDCHALANTELLDQQVVSLKGEVLVPRAQVAFIQAVQ